MSADDRMVPFGKFYNLLSRNAEVDLNRSLCSFHWMSGATCFVLKALYLNVAFPGLWFIKFEMGNAIYRM